MSFVQGVLYSVFCAVCLYIIAACSMRTVVRYQNPTGLYNSPCCTDLVFRFVRIHAVRIYVVRVVAVLSS